MENACRLFLSESPHLLQYVQNVQIMVFGYKTRDDLAWLCRAGPPVIRLLRSIRVRNLRLYADNVVRNWDDLPLDISSAIRNLIQRSAITRLEIGFPIFDATSFIDLLQGCHATLEHLVLWAVRVQSSLPRKEEVHHSRPAPPRLELISPIDIRLYMCDELQLAAEQLHMPHLRTLFQSYDIKGQVSNIPVWFPAFVEEVVLVPRYGVEEGLRYYPKPSPGLDNVVSSRKLRIATCDEGLVNTKDLMELEASYIAKYIRRLPRPYRLEYIEFNFTRSFRIRADPTIIYKSVDPLLARLYDEGPLRRVVVNSVDDDIDIVCAMPMVQERHILEFHILDQPPSSLDYVGLVQELY